MKRRDFLTNAAWLAAGLSLPLTRAMAADPVNVQMYKSPECTCCEGHARHLEDNGFKVTLAEDPDIFTRKAQLGIPEALYGCHTALVGKYVIEGHVPAKFVRRLLASQQDIIGLAIPGMPGDVPGMPGERDYQVDIFVIDETAKSVFATI